MATDLTKMVEEQLSFISTGPLYEILKAMASKIEANREEIERLKTEESNPNKKELSPRRY